MLKNFFIETFGAYKPITYELCDIDGTCNTIIPNGLAGVDFVYILSVLSFLIVLFCFLKILGGLICK